MSEPRWCDLSKKQKLALICEDATPAVTAAVEKHFRGKPASALAHPQDAMNVLLREAWRANHGDTAEWDRVAAAGGVVLP